MDVYVSSSTHMLRTKKRKYMHFEIKLEIFQIIKILQTLDSVQNFSHNPSGKFIVCYCHLIKTGHHGWSGSVIERQPENQRVTGSIPSAGNILGCGPGPR